MRQHSHDGIHAAHAQGIQTLHHGIHPPCCATAECDYRIRALIESVLRNKGQNDGVDMPWHMLSCENCKKWTRRGGVPSVARRRIVGLNVREVIGKTIRSYLSRIRKNESCSLESKRLEGEYMG